MQHQLVKQQQHPVLHILAQARDELNVLSQELVGQRLREVALVTEQLAKKAPGQVGHRLAVVDVAGREVEVQQLAAVVDDQVQLEAEEPAHRGLASGGQTVEHPVAPDTPVVTDGQGGSIDERDTGDRAEAGFQIETQRPQRRWHQFHKAGIADQVGKLAAQMPLHVLRVVALEVAVTRHVKVDDEGHDLAGGQARPATGPVSWAEELWPFLGAKRLAEIIDSDEKVQ